MAEQTEGLRIAVKLQEVFKDAFGTSFCASFAVLCQEIAEFFAMGIDPRLNGIFPCVTIGRIADIMPETGGLYMVSTRCGTFGREVQRRSESLGQTGADFGDFQGVCQTIMHVVDLGQGVHLRLPCEASEGGGEDNALDIHLGRRAWGRFNLLIANGFAIGIQTQPIGSQEGIPV